MFDIYFDLSNMRQVATEEEETFVEFDIEGEQISFNFELDLPESPLTDDYPVIIRKKSTNGYTCKSCNEIYPYAEAPNQKDGTFKCYSCRKYG